MEQEGRFPPRCHFGRNSCAGFCPMCFGGSVTLLLYLTSITHIAVNRLTEDQCNPRNFV
jgi:hypothetical protein